MDGRTFDIISRTIAHGATRRRIVGAAIAAVFGNGIALGAAPASAVQRPTCRQLAAGCTRATQCCSGYCERRTSVPRRKRHRCGCGNQLDLCGSTCHDLQTDDNNCGACGTVCPNETTCQAGVCTCEPEDGASVCLVSVSGAVVHACSRVPYVTWTCTDTLDCQTSGCSGSGCVCAVGFREFGTYQVVKEWTGGDESVCLGWIGCD